jgi:hypothetical protein
MKHVSLEELNKTGQIENLEKIPVLESAVPVFEIKELPSLFKPYPIKKDITYKRYSYSQVRILSQSNVSLKDNWQFILSGINTPFPKNKLTIPDFFYIALWRRLQTVGPSNFFVRTHCPYCGSLNKIKCNDSDLAYDELKVPDLPANLPFRNKKHEFTPTTLEDSFFLMDKDLYDDPIAQLAVQCRNFPFEEIYKYLNSEELSYDDGMMLDELDQLFHHRMLPIKHTCQGIIKGYENIEMTIEYLINYYLEFFYSKDILNDDKKIIFKDLQLKFQKLDIQSDELIQSLLIQNHEEYKNTSDFFELIEKIKLAFKETKINDSLLTLCNENFDCQLDGGGAIIMPFFRDGISPGHRISFGKNTGDFSG